MLYVQTCYEDGHSQSLCIFHLEHIIIDKRATEICTSYEALNNYWKLLPTQCMKQFCITLLQVACISKAIKRKGGQISLVSSTPKYT